MTDKADTLSPVATAAIDGREGARPTPEVSVLLPHYNDLKGLRICLEKLAAQTFGRDKIEIIIADNMSDCGLDAVRAVAGDFAKVVLATIRGPGPARNAAAAEASGTVLAFTDTDCSPAPTWLEEGLNALNDYDIVGGSMNVTVANPERPTAVESFERVFAFDNRRYVEKQGYTVTANLITTKEVFAKVGGFVSTSISEDVEWCRRAVAAGYTLGYAPKAQISHPAREDWTQLKKKWLRLVRQQYFENEKNGHGKFRWLAFNIVVVLSPFAHTVTVIRSDRLTTWSQRLDALRVLFQLRAWRFAEGMKILFSRTVDDPWIRKAEQKG